MASPARLLLLALTSACPALEGDVPDAASSPDATIPDAGISPPPDAVPVDVLRPEDTGPPPPSLAIGTGVTEHVPLEDGAELPLVMGPQGGYHIDVTFRACAIEAMDARLQVWGHDAETGGQVSEELERILTIRRVLYDDDGGCWTRVGDFLVFDTFDPSTIVGRRVRVRAVVREPGGLSVQDEREIIVR
ncbi:MAG: hypothetical protein KF901_06285 [Myxococcales bacterium]|nr:hypothetical protein [Myxococcales bacterium]